MVSQEYGSLAGKSTVTLKETNAFFPIVAHQENVHTICWITVTSQLVKFYFLKKVKTLKKSS